MKLSLCVLSVVALAIAPAAMAVSTELITNGGFEAGPAGWVISDQAGGSGTFAVVGPGPTFISGEPSVGPAAGNLYAVSDQTGPGAHALAQPFVVPGPASSVVLSFDMFANDWDGGPFVNPAGLDFNAAPNQHARVDILSAAAGPFDTGAGVLGNFYLGVDPHVTNPNPYTHYSFDVTSLVGAGGAFQLRFAEVDDQLFFNQGVDNVSILANIGQAVPEPLTMLAVALSAGSLGGYLRRRRAC